jgi:hypothetical protein
MQIIFLLNSVENSICQFYFFTLRCTSVQNMGALSWMDTLMWSFLGHLTLHSAHIMLCACAMPFCVQSMLYLMTMPSYTSRSFSYKILICLLASKMVLNHLSETISVSWWNDTWQCVLAGSHSLCMQIVRQNNNTLLMPCI